MTRPTAVCLLALPFVAGAPSQALAATRYLTIVNDDQRAIVWVELADAGTGAYALLDLPSPLIGGREGQATAAVPPGPCRRDIRVVYRDASTLTVAGWNTCRQTQLHVGAAHQAALRH